MNLGSLNIAIGVETAGLTRGLAAAKEGLAGAGRDAAAAGQSFAGLTREAGQGASGLSLFRQALSGAGSTLGEVRDRAREAGISFYQLGRGISDVGRTMTAALTVPIAGAAAAILKAGTDTQQAFDRIRVATGATGQQLAAYQQVAKNVGGTVPNSLNEVSQAVAGLAQRTGLTGKPLEDLSRQVLTLSRITGTDLNEAIRQSSRVFGDWGIKAQQQGAALDLLFRASQQTGIGVQQLEESMVRSGAPLRQLGFSFGEAAALVGKFEKEGVNSQLVLGSLRIELSRLAKAGITDAHQAFLQIIESIKGAGSASAANGLAVKAFGARAGPDMAAAIREGRFEIEKLWKGISQGGDTIRKAGQDTLHFGEQFAILRNKVELALRPLGQELMKALSGLAGHLIDTIPLLTGLVHAFVSLPAPVQLAVAGLLGLVAAAGPLLLVIGNLVRIWPVLVAGWTAISTVATGTLAPAIAGLLGPIGLVVLAIAALLTAWTLDWGGMRTTTTEFLAWISPALEAGWSGILEGAKGLFATLSQAWGAMWDGMKAAAGPAGKFLGEAFINAFLGPVAPLLKLIPEQLKGVWGKFTNAVDAYNTAQQFQGIAAGSTPVTNMNETLTRSSADLALGKSSLTGGKSGFDFGQLSTAKAKETPLQKEQTRYTEELTQAHAKLTQLLAGEDNIAAQVAAKYHLLTAAQRENLTAVLQQIHDQQILQQSQKAYSTDLGKLNAEIRRLKQGHDAEASGVDALREKYPGLGNAMLAAMNNAIQWKKHLIEMRQEAHAAAEAIRGIQLRILEAGTDSRVDQAAARLFGAKVLERGGKPTSATDLFNRFLDRGQQAQAEQEAGKSAFASIDERIAAERQKLFENFGPLEAGGVGLKDRPSRVLSDLTGPRPEQFLDDRQLATLKQKSVEFIRTRDATNQAAAAIGVYDQEWEKLNTVIGTSGVNLEVLQKQFGVLTGKSATAREVMEKFGVDLATLPKAVQANIRAFLDMQHRLDLFKEVTAGTQQVFENMFQHLYQHGFKGFFQSVIQGFEQMLQQMAAKYLASKLTNLVMGALGGFFGSKDIPAANLEGIFGMAGGGSVQAAHRYMVGERGPEMFVAPSNGSIVPNAQLAGAGGGDIHIHMNVSTPDVASFRQNSKALTADALRHAQQLSRRNG